jgi:carboxyl-terminal processing protease
MDEPLKINRQLRNRFFSISAAIYVAIVLALGSFSVGLYFGGQTKATGGAAVGKVTNKNAPPSYADKNIDFSKFWDVWSLIKSDYLRQPVNETELYYGALKGVVAALKDPYSIYFDPDEASAFAKELDGTFEGIGAEIGYKNSQIIVIAPLPQTPAANAGLMAGDMILTINGVDTSAMSLDEAVSKIRGPGGTVVTLSIFRDGWKEPRDFVITRQQITVASVQSKTINLQGKDDPKGNIAEITISQFTDDTISGFDKAARAATLAGAKGIVLDLRNDPGGYLDAAVEVIGGWTTDTAVIEHKSDGTEQTFKPKRKPVFGDTPTVVLVNGGSASASEIVSGALQDYGKATLVGETTFGKGSVQNYQDLPDGSAIKLTIAEWLTPKKRSIDKQGITPNVTIKNTDDDIKAGIDEQLNKALDILGHKIAK